MTTVLVAALSFIYLPISAQKRLILNVVELDFLIGVLFLMLLGFFLRVGLRQKEPNSYKITYLSILIIFSFVGYGLSGYSKGIVLNTYPLLFPLLAAVHKAIPKQTQKLTKISIIFLILYGIIVNIHKLKSDYLVYGNYPIKSLDTQLNIDRALDIKVSSKHKAEIKKILEIITDNSRNHDAIICFPYCPMMYYLSGRKTPTYHFFYYQETFRQADQTRHIQEIENDPPRIVLIQKKGSIEKEAEYEDKRLKSVKHHLSSLYELKHETSNFLIYY